MRKSGKKEEGGTSRYRILVRYMGDTIRTHGWVAGVVVPSSDPVWRTVDMEQLDAIRANPLFVVERVEDAPSR